MTELTRSFLQLVRLCSLITIFQGVAWLGPQLRASNEALRRARVARARGTNQATPLPAGGIFQHSANPPFGLLETADSKSYFSFQGLCST
jgi:hypothetical protein